MSWDWIGLIVGIGLIFTTDFETWKDHLWKAAGVIMVMVSTYRLVGELLL